MSTIGCGASTGKPSSTLMMVLMTGTATMLINKALEEKKMCVCVCVCI
jgi:hypothetical protein